MNVRTWRRLAVLILLTFAVGTAGGAVYAYWTAEGSGTGAATVGSLDQVTVNQSTVLDPFYPGDSPQGLAGTFDNPNDGPVVVTTVTVTIGSVTKAPGAPAGTCDATDFTIADGTATVNDQVPIGNDVGAWSGPTVQFNNKAAANQDACQGASVTLAYAIP